MSINVVSILCEVVRNPEILTPKTYVIGKFSVKYRKDPAKDAYSYFDVEAWGEKLVQKVQKFAQQGQMILITGKLDSSTWQDKETGKNRSKVFIVANDVISLDALIHPESNSNQETPSQHQLPTKRPYQKPSIEQDEGRVLVDSERDFANHKKEPPPPENDGQPWMPPENGEPPF